MDKTFADYYCERRGLDGVRFIDDLLWRCYYPHAVLPMRFFSLLDSRLIETDREVVKAIGSCRSLREIGEFMHTIPWYYGGEWEMRQRLRFRISTRRLMHLARPLLPSTAT